MTNYLKIAIGQYSDKGRKASNQDFYGAYVPTNALLEAKGISLCLADGISSSQVSDQASETAVKGFLEDYYSTPDSWSVKTSAQRVLMATNSWLYAQTRNSQHRYQMDRGYVCTFSAIIFKSQTAYVFHIGDARVYRLCKKNIEQLTDDHRIWIADDKSYLSRALGMKEHLDIDYHSLALEQGDVFILMTDGIYEHIDEKFIIEVIDKHQTNLDQAAKLIVNQAMSQGSADNLTIQIARIEHLPQKTVDDIYYQLVSQPFAPEIKARMQFDGYEIIRELHMSHRSHIYLARDIHSHEQVVLKMPSIDLRDDVAYMERFLLEEWVARRVNNAHVLKSPMQSRKRSYVYIVTEYIQGQTLTQWMIDNPLPDLETVRQLVEQIAAGLGAIHRQEMLHQDLRPDNIIIDKNGTVKIIDFGSVYVAGLREISSPLQHQSVLGTAQYSAPEYFIGELGTTRSDLYALAVISYQMLTGDLPYGAQVARAQSKAAQRKLKYKPAFNENRAIPVWIDEAIRKAVQPNPNKRYSEITEFIYDLRHPNAQFINKTRPPLIERNPLLFWQGLSFILFIIVLIQLFY